MGKRVSRKFEREKKENQVRKFRSSYDDVNRKVKNVREQSKGEQYLRAFVSVDGSMGVALWKGMRIKGGLAGLWRNKECLLICKWEC